MDDGLVEFMDIHSEGFTFLKNKPNMRNRTIIRAHNLLAYCENIYIKKNLKV